MLDSVSTDSVRSHVKHLQDFVSREITKYSSYAASEWIYEKFESFGLDSVYRDTFTFIRPTGIGVPPNIVGIRKGVLYPDSCYTIICGHYDSGPTAQPDSAPGADDNASGTAAVIEAARIMRRYRFGYGIRFIAFSAEECGMDGSYWYATQARRRGDDIRAVYNFDMIGYVDSEPESVEVCGCRSCESLMDHFIACADTYTVLLTKKRLDHHVSDDMVFCGSRYQAVGMIEDWPLNNPHYHTTHDTIGAGFNNLAFCTEVIKAGIAALASTSGPVGISEENAHLTRARNLLMVYPNPTRAFLAVRANFPVQSIRIYDVCGKLVKEERLKGFAGETKISLKGMSAGIYFVKAKAQDNTFIEKIVVTK